MSVSKSGQLPVPRPIPHHQEGYPFVNPSASPKAKEKHMPTYKRYRNIESIAETSRITMPEVVVILGSGPNGRAAWPRIPKDAFVIAVNEGVNISTDHPKECAFKPTIWIVNDPGVLDKPYWVSANKNYQGIRIFGNSTLDLIRKKFLYVRSQIDAVREGRVFSIPRGPFHKHEQGIWFHDPTIFKPGGTVCAAALWIACIKGPAKRVYLCGIDMSMDIHYSNPVQPAHPDPRHGIEWHSSRPALDERIRYFKSLGMEIYTLSETKLRNVEMREKVE
jgi:hypothetical protein